MRMQYVAIYYVCEEFIQTLEQLAHDCYQSVNCSTLLSPATIGQEIIVSPLLPLSAQS